MDMRSGSATLVWRSSVSVCKTGLYLHRYEVWISHTGLEELCVCVYDWVVLTWIWALDQSHWFGGTLHLCVWLGCTYMDMRSGSATLDWRNSVSVCMTGLYLHGYEVWISHTGLEELCVYVYDWVVPTWIWGLDQPHWFGGALCLCVWLGCTYMDVRSGSATLVWRSSVSVCMTGLYLHGYEVWISHTGLEELCVSVYDWVVLTWIWGLDQPHWFGGALCLCVALGCTYMDMRSGSATLIWRSSVSVCRTGLYLYGYEVWISHTGLEELCVCV